MTRFTSLIIVVVLSITSCKKDNNTPDNMNSDFMPSATDSLIAQANLMNEVHPTSGTVKLYKNDNEYILQFENLQSDNGPDLRVYLSPNKSASPFIDLGSLKAVSGNFEYTFDLNTDVTANNNVLIWCEDFSVLFGSALLQ